MAIAVIRTGGKQYKVFEGAKLKVEKLIGNAGDSFSFNDILLYVNKNEVKVGKPVLDGAKVVATILQQGRGDKKIVFRYHSKTRYRKKKRQRQDIKEIKIENISA